MTKDAFVNLIKQAMQSNGYSRIKIYPALFGRTATISAKDRNGRRRELKAYLKTSFGKTKLVIESNDNMSWIDEFEVIDAIIND